MFYPSKHTYLHKSLCLGFDQRTVNRLMDRYMKPPKNARDEAGTYPKLSTQSPSIFAPCVDPTRAKKAFGDRAIPKLKRQLSHSDTEIVMQALNTLLDLAYDPEKGFEEIRLGVVDRLGELMLHEKDFIREKVCMIFFVLAGQEAGRRVILKRYELLKNLFRLMEDEVMAVRHKAQMAVEMISRSVLGAVALNKADCLLLVLRLIGGMPQNENDEILLLCLNTLENLLEDDCADLAMKHNAIDILLEKVNHPREEIVGTALSCLALLCYDSKGRSLADQREVSTIFCKKLFDENRFVQAKAANAFAFAILETSARLRGSYPCVLERLLQLLEDYHSSELKLLAAKALSNLAEVPDSRSFLLEHNKQRRIETIFTGDDKEIEKHRDILLQIVRWKP